MWGAVISLRCSILGLKVAFEKLLVVEIGRVTVVGTSGIVGLNYA